MNVKFLLNQSERLISDNAPTILAGAAVVGTVATAYLAARGAYKSATENDHEDFVRGSENKPPLTTKAKVAANWMNYVPAIGAAGVTISCVVCANHITAKRAMAMTAAYSLSESRLKEYKTAVEKKLGVKGSEEVESEIIADKMDRTAASMVFLGDGETLCFDAYSGRYFHSTKNKIDSAANQINLLVLKENYQTLDDFWDLVGLEATAYGQETGWTIDCPLEILYSTMISSDDKPCLVVKYDAEPLRRWNHIG